MDAADVYEHLKTRGMTPGLYRVLSVAEDVAVFGLWDFSGKLVGYQNYRPFAERNCKNVKEARYFTYLPKKTNGYFGLESLGLFDGTVYVVEGVFKAAKLHTLGVASVALMGSETRQYVSQLELMRRPYLGVGDNDSAGEKFARGLGGFTSPRDLDEMSNEEVLEMLNGY